MIEAFTEVLEQHRGKIRVQIHSSQLCVLSIDGKFNRYCRIDQITHPVVQTEFIKWLISEGATDITITRCTLSVYIYKEELRTGTVYITKNIEIRRVFSNTKNQELKVRMFVGDLILAGLNVPGI